MNQTAQHGDRKRYRVLVVDDTPDNLFLMNGLLEDRYEVMQAASGADAMACIAAGAAPDLVLLDIMMPGMDGYEVLRRLRQHPATLATPVIFLTALATERDRQLGLGLGAVDYLSKPVDPEMVIGRIGRHLGSSAQSRRLDALSERLARHLPEAAWHELFHGRGVETIAFRQKELTVLFVESGDLGSWTGFDQESFLHHVIQVGWEHDGAVDAFGWGGTVAFFESASDAVRASLALQRTTTGLQLRIGVHHCICDIATFRVGSEGHCTLIGPETGLAAHIATSAAYGSIVISPEAYVLVRDLVQQDVQGCLIMEEFEYPDRAMASLTPTPMSGGVASSTFAGLGAL